MSDITNMIISFRGDKEIFDYVAKQKNLVAELEKRGVSLVTNVIPSTKAADDATILGLTNKVQELENEAYNWQQGYYANVGRLNDIDSTLSSIKDRLPASKVEDKYNSIEQQIEDLREQYKKLPTLMTEEDKEGIDEQLKAITNTITLVKSNLARQLSDAYQGLLALINTKTPKSREWVDVDNRETLTEQSILLVCYSSHVDEKNTEHYTDKTTNNARVVKYEKMLPPDPELIEFKLEVDGKEYDVTDPKIISIKEWKYKEA